MESTHNQPVGTYAQWVRTFNAIVRDMLASGKAGNTCIPLDPQSMINEAIRNTGLSDFGPDDIWREALDVLSESLEKDAKLTPYGRIISRSDIVSGLEARLQIEEAYRLDPGIADEEISQPIFIVGLPRTGTTILHELLAQDPAHRVPLNWEARYPCPPPEEATYETDPRIKMCNSYFDSWLRVVPEFMGMHEIHAQVPCECVWLMLPTFASEDWFGRANLPSFGAWYAVADKRPLYSYHHKMLKLLQRHYRRERWVLKAPSHMAVLDTLLEEYPDARIAMTHRDPLQSMGSTASILETLYGLRSDEADFEMIRTSFSGDGTAQRLDAAMATRAQLPAERFCDVRFQDLMSDPFGTIGNIYKCFGIEYSAKAELKMREYLANKPRNKYGPHEYSFHDLGLDLARERKRFKPYQDRFGVPSEVS